MQICWKATLFALVAIGVTALDSSPAQAADSCQPVFEALTKIVTTPSHSYTTSTAANGGKQRTAETIMTQGKKYIRVNGKWMAPSVTTAEVLEQEEENEKNGKATCQSVRSEAVNGEAVMVYSLRRETGGFQRGLPDLDLEVNGNGVARGAGG